jgi:hypothetical protein
VLGTKRISEYLGAKERGICLTDMQVQDHLDREDKIVEYQKFAREVAVIIPECISNVSQNDADEVSMKMGAND